MYTDVSVKKMVEDTRSIEEKVNNLRKLGVEVKIVNNFGAEKKQDRIRVILGRMANIITDMRF
ncbi:MULTISPECIES: hypothetical protein [Bacillus cereus group]|uniref:Uncharacterized protein n=1 Tax=Bacillus mycoides TaxID=1405 RepID=C2XU69_BACMY|nr:MULTISPECIES: hypothetical protein [Bacillus cereus group]EEL70786.1 hypothetical protein bcere0026_22400 [Bacillus mycoides]OLR21796.1 hypothetical protein BLD50_31445 [Bacillus cereus]